MAMKNATGPRARGATRTNGHKKKSTAKAPRFNQAPSPDPTSQSGLGRDSLYLQMLNCSDDAFMLLQSQRDNDELVDLVLLEANTSALNLLKRDAADAIGQTASLLPHALFGPILNCAQWLTPQAPQQNTSVLHERAYLKISLHQLDADCVCVILRNAHKPAVGEQLQEKLARFLEAAPDAVVVADLEGRYLHANAAACELLGYSREEILHKQFSDIIPDIQRRTLLQAKKQMADGAQLTSEWSIQRSDGRVITVEVSGKILKDGHWLGFVRDITRRKNNERELRLAAAVFDNTREAIVVTDAERNVLAVNGAFTTLTGYSEREAKGHILCEYLYRSGKHDEEFYQTLWQRVDADGHWRGEVWSRRKDGEVFPSWQNISAVSDDNGNINHYVLILSDISEKKAAEMKLSYLAHHDALTGLANRIAFNGNLERAIHHAERNSSKVALLYIDLDNFKIVNDTHGHLAGDQLLQITADRLRRCVRGEDAVARMGGDEFTIVLENISSLEDAVGVAEKVIHAMDLPVRLASGEVDVGLSIGISLFPDHAQSLNDVTRTADAAMYAAKKYARNSYQVFHPQQI
ncbi:diguanylate cyclase domain-containing protein [Teredinibacter turnerae]|uniref:diguanylate cyclase domain-containing protein n=1 Tax=Teredinibacter turnerae TaxID=2426 RepID=UPI0003821CE9|nr:diguanylate cyclase [Teredinibacter turnerae]